ncbi:AAA family ATPase [Streptomyces antarcticus]|uniref:AAA family ATPase n=1 Tax=Streptomyces antarcticus TaxID=2996458 RepID=UPI00226E2E24|nr:MULTISPECIES: AAA family ATPase [unclassified Streptomyces]MCY0941897.1 AAA family ATPase [Streptomyces sp. H34-AA3]MCZ4082830.1 AAA family ATPase [Streptomyces sp. H34-S5]
MFSLTQSTRIRGAAGEPIPNSFKSLKRLEVEFRRSELSLVVAGPGTGKSLFALFLAMTANIPVLYFSADSSAATQVARATAMVTGDDSRVIKEALVGGDFSEYEAALGGRWWARFNFSARPTQKEIETHLLCYLEVYGCTPHLLVVDNITNVDTGEVASAESYTFGLEGLCEYLSEMARETSAHVLGLHHVTGEHSDGLNPIPLSGVKGKVHRVPSLILTIHKEVDGMNSRILNVSPVKNREGFEDSSGATFASFRLNRSNLRLEELDTELPGSFVA